MKAHGSRCIELAAMALLSALAGAACGAIGPPTYAEVVVLEGDSYQRGLQHGRRLASKIRSLYTMLLETNLLPYLNREQGDVMNFLVTYQQPEYQEGRFSYRMLLESGQNLLGILEQGHPEFVEEMRGIAEGADVPFEHILIMNTFVDTMLAFRSVTLFIRQIQSPRLMEVEFLGQLADGIDNNGDGAVDESDDGVVKHRSGEGVVPGYEPSPRAVMVEVPPEAKIRLRFYDPPKLSGFTQNPNGETKPGDRQGMNPESVRLVLDGVLYGADHPAVESRLLGEKNEELEVIFSPPGGLPPAALVTLQASAHNVSQIEDPPPVHPRVMRQERLVFSTRGYGRQPEEIDNLGLWDGKTMPTALALAVRGTATPDGETRLAHHLALLNAGLVHKHSVLFLHRPPEGPPFCVLGWPGLVWGFSGLSARGLAVAFNPSDTLDNPLAGQVKKDVMNAKLLETGTPAGVKLRLLLENAGDVGQAVEALSAEPNTFGWNFILADAAGGLAAVELDADILQEADGGVHVVRPEDRLANRGPDDLHLSTHFHANVPDISSRILIFDVRPQRFWSSAWYRSLRTDLVAAQRLAGAYGRLDTRGLVEVLREPELVDRRESMNAAVFEPARGRLFFAAGTSPATDGDFREFSLEALP